MIQNEMAIITNLFHYKTSISFLLIYKKTLFAILKLFTVVVNSLLLILISLPTIYKNILLYFLLTIWKACNSASIFCLAYLPANPKIISDCFILFFILKFKRKLLMNNSYGY